MNFKARLNIQQPAKLPITQSPGAVALECKALQHAMWHILPLLLQGVCNNIIRHFDIDAHTALVSRGFYLTITLSINSELLQLCARCLREIPVNWAVQLLGNAAQVNGRTGQPIQAGYNKRVTVTDIVQARLQLRAFARCTGLLLIDLLAIRQIVTARRSKPLGQAQKPQTIARAHGVAFCSAEAEGIKLRCCRLIPEHKRVVRANHDTAAAHAIE